MLLPAIVASRRRWQHMSCALGCWMRCRCRRPFHWTVGILAMDALVYANHRLDHNIGFLWRIHAVHHSDPEMDVTTTFRHHPLEVMLDSLLVGGCRPAHWNFARPGRGVFAARHGDTDSWPTRISDARLARGAARHRCLVTPGFHQMHHSREIGRNQQQLWPGLRILGSPVRQQQRPGRRRGTPVEFGLDHFRDAGSQLPHRLLLQPVLPQHSSPQGEGQASGTTRNRSVSPVS